MRKINVNKRKSYVASIERETLQNILTTSLKRYMKSNADAWRTGQFGEAVKASKKITRVA